MTGGGSSLTIVGEGFGGSYAGSAPRIGSLLIKPVSAVCNLDCSYCFYLDRDADPYKSLPARRMSLDTLERIIDTYLFYSYPESVFAFQGGEPTLAGLPFFEKVVEWQQRYGRAGQSVSNALQTNGILLDKDWCALFRSYHWLIGLSLDGPEAVHDRNRPNKAGHGTWKRVVETMALLKREKVEFNILCVLSEANVGQPAELYRFFRKLGADNLQFIPLAEFDGRGNPLPGTITAAQYGRFLCGLFETWWPERRKVRVRFFDNLAEALAGQKPGSCTLHQTCDSYAVVEHNGDVYPCDFFVEETWKLGNAVTDPWPEIARRLRRRDFAWKKSLATPECAVCEYRDICLGGCPKFRRGPHGRFEDLDWFCEAYKMAFSHTIPRLKAELLRSIG
jgi:uncharacterized protein